MHPENVALRTSQAGLKLVRDFEGLRTKAYLDGNGVPTIGVGHTGKQVHLGLTVTEAQAIAWETLDVQEAEHMVKFYVDVPLKQCQFDSLVDFVFNLGAGHFAKSTLRRVVNSNGSAAEIESAFCLWATVGGAVSDGLLRRRKAEAEMFNG